MPFIPSGNYTGSPAVNAASFHGDQARDEAITVEEDFGAQSGSHLPNNPEFIHGNPRMNSDNDPVLHIGHKYDRKPEGGIDDDIDLESLDPLKNKNSNDSDQHRHHTYGKSEFPNVVHVSSPQSNSCLPTGCIFAGILDQSDKNESEMRIKERPGGKLEMFYFMEFRK
ncbi:unnamed protein product [Rodentolepis nana]|uniref:Uncharacterized protein n=1 Tax=Rodentolepis nana TaxID=102285 RepID=A0A3P7SSJ5_RODNA|nr:unnamed protein product [Rodentolepis nana]